MHWKHSAFTFLRSLNLLTIDPWFSLFCALLFLTIPINWLLAAASAALFHELCHLAVIVLLKEKVHHIHVSLSGILIHTSFSDDKKELLAALAGPLGSFALLSLCHIYPRLALCAFAQGLFNLLPLHSLDGGRVLLCILRICAPGAADRIFRYCTIIMGTLLLILGIVGVYYLRIPVHIALILLLSIFVRKIPCKGSINAVQ